MGNTFDSPAPHAAPSGSSPPAWGIRSTWPFLRLPPWFIPTRVGNTLTAIFSCALAAVHPHPRGEYTWLRQCRTGARGSSPPAWGILRREPHEPAGRRFIPTRVGNTPLHTSRSCVPAVHPTRSGEYSNILRPQRYAPVHPHRVGNTFPGIPSDHRPRFIPTRVGNTVAGEAWGKRETVHPHRVGNTILGFQVGVIRAVHPHPRGEYVTKIMRGEVIIGFITHPRGEYVTRFDASARSPVHPHPRGEYFISAAGTPAGTVHPHPRGEYEHPSSLRPACRFHPTRVGNTARITRFPRT